MMVFRTEIKYLKNASRLFDRVYVKRGGLDLSKEVLRISVGQKAAELPAVKIGGQKNSATQLSSNPTRLRRAERQNFFSNRRLRWLVALLPFELQRPTEHLYIKI